MNRIEPIKQDIQSESNVDDRMELIMYALNDTVAPIPEEGNICTFKYFAKTPNISYDQHPLVAVTELFQWGFRGINFHHQEYRQYTWEELGTQVYIVQQDELDDLLSLSYRYRTNFTRYNSHLKMVFIYLVPVIHILTIVSRQVLLAEQYIPEFLILPKYIVYTF